MDTKQQPEQPPEQTTIIEDYRGPLNSPLVDRPAEIGLSTPDAKATTDDDDASLGLPDIHSSANNVTKAAYVGGICAALALAMAFVLSFIRSPLYDTAWVDNQFLKLLLSPLPVIFVGLLMTGWSVYKASQTSGERYFSQILLIAIMAGLFDAIALVLTATLQSRLY